MYRPLFRVALVVTLGLLAGCGGSDAPPSLPAVDVSPVAAADPGSSLPADWQRHSTFMEIYVRAFKDSNGDGVGDLRGLINNLDYLQELGIRGIWLMPVNQSYDRDHGYAVNDYRAIEADYGSMADFEELLQEAHARGIGVIMDYVINHTGSGHPLFVNARSGAGNAWRDWYVWSDVHPEGWSIYGRDPWYSTGKGYYFAGFWEHMPDLNLANPEVEAWQNSNLRFWLNKGVDGFRFDAVGNLYENSPSQWESQPQNYLHMGRVAQLLQGYEQRYMVCESPADPGGFNAWCGSAFAFGLNYNLVGAAMGSDSAISYVANYFKSAAPSMATLAANHDSFAGARLYDQVGGDMARYRLIAGTYLTLPGTPFVYYGEEIGMAGGNGLSGDHSLRSPLSWTGSTSNGGFTSGTPFRALARNVTTHNIASQRSDPDSLFSYYKTLIGLRNQHPALSIGSYSHSQVHGKVLSFQRLHDSDRVLVVINYGNSETTITAANLPTGITLTPLYPAGASAQVINDSGQADITLPAHSLQIYDF